MTISPHHVLHDRVICARCMAGRQAEATKQPKAEAAKPGKASDRAGDESV